MDAIASSATVSFRKMVDRKSGWSALVKSDSFQKSDYKKLKYLNFSTLKIDQKRVLINRKYSLKPADQYQQLTLIDTKLT